MSKDVTLILQRAVEISGVRRPKGLGRWMQRHFNALYEGFEKQPGGPDWEAFATALAEAGITAPDGSALKADTARRAWARTLKKVSKLRADKSELPTIVRPAPRVRPVVQPPAMPEVPSLDLGEPEPDPAPEFRLLRRPKKTGE